MSRQVGARHQLGETSRRGRLVEAGVLPLPAGEKFLAEPRKGSVVPVSYRHRPLTTEQLGVWGRVEYRPNRFHTHSIADESSEVAIARGVSTVTPAPVFWEDEVSRRRTNTYRRLLMRYLVKLLT